MKRQFMIDRLLKNREGRSTCKHDTDYFHSDARFPVLSTMKIRN